MFVDGEDRQKSLLLVIVIVAGIAIPPLGGLFLIVGFYWLVFGSVCKTIRRFKAKPGDVIYEKDCTKRLFSNFLSLVYCVILLGLAVLITAFPIILFVR